MKAIIGIDEIDDIENEEIETTGRFSNRVAQGQSSHNNLSSQEPQKTPTFNTGRKWTMGTSGGGGDYLRPQGSSTSSTSSFSSNLKSSTSRNMNIVIVEPNGFDDCSNLVEKLKAKMPVVINLEHLDSGTALRIFDFLSGGVFALNGTAKKISNHIFMFSPENVKVSSFENKEPEEI